MRNQMIRRNLLGQLVVVDAKWLKRVQLNSRLVRFASVVALVVCLLAISSASGQSYQPGFTYGVDLTPDLAPSDYVARPYVAGIDEAELREQLAAEEAASAGSLESALAQRPDLEAAAEDLLLDSLTKRWFGGPGQLPSGSQELSKRFSKQQNNDNANLAYYLQDVNSHLPPTGELGDDDEQRKQQQQQPVSTIRAPVNEPEEFEEYEAKLGRLTDLINHQMSNSAERQQMLMRLLARNITTNKGSAAVNDPNDDEYLYDKHLHLDMVERLIKLMNEKEDSVGYYRDDDETEEGRPSENVKGDGLDKSRLQASSSSSSSPLDSSTSEASTSEYIDHPLVLFGHQLVQGGAGEGRQLLGPEGTFENIQVVKSDSAIPSYCDPPNPCPIGFTAKDGCLENFINSASFSREYQAKQSCSCDNEHSLFNCASPSGGGQEAADKQQQQEQAVESTDASATADKLSTLARTIQNRFGDLASVRKLISDQQQAEALAQNSNNNDDSNYLVRSARKWSPELHYHKMELD